MNVISNTTTYKIRDFISVTIGAIRTARKREIVLVYVDEGEHDPVVFRYDRLTCNDRKFISLVAQDPLNVLARKKSGCEPARAAA